MMEILKSLRHTHMVNHALLSTTTTKKRCSCHFHKHYEYFWVLLYVPFTWLGWTHSFVGLYSTVVTVMQRFFLRSLQIFFYILSNLRYFVANIYFKKYDPCSLYVKNHLNLFADYCGIFALVKKFTPKIEFPTEAWQLIVIPIFEEYRTNRLLFFKTSRKIWFWKWLGIQWENMI